VYREPTGNGIRPAFRATLFPPHIHRTIVVLPPIVTADEPQELRPANFRSSDTTISIVRANFGELDHPA
jgi:hypothetical protein